MADGLKGHVSRATLNAEALADLMASRFGPSSFALVRRVDDISFVEFPREGAAQLLASWAEGRVFDGGGEMRWKAGGDGYSVLLLEEEGAAGGDAAGVVGAPSGFTPLHAGPLDVSEPATRSDHGFLLWGTRLAAGLWWEARVPRPLSYPANAAGTPPRISFFLYSEGGSVRWVRFRGLIGEAR